MQRVANKIWVYWLMTDILLILDVFKVADGLLWAIALTAIQVVHFRMETNSIRNFAVQVRIAYLLLLIVCLWAPLYWLIFLIILGTTAMVVFDYCFLARFMSLMPWNHSEKFSWSLIKNTFFTAPIEGSVEKVSS